MSSNEEKKLLLDILTSADSIDEYLKGRRNFSEYKSSKITRRAVERELEIIGEAVNQLLKLNLACPLSYSRLIVDLRNRIIHSYDAINDTIIWKIIIKDLPVLMKEVDQLLAE